MEDFEPNYLKLIIYPSNIAWLMMSKILIDSVYECPQVVVNSISRKLTILSGDSLNNLPFDYSQFYILF